MLDIPYENVSDKVVYNVGYMKKALFITQDPKLPDLTEKYSALAVIEINRVTGTLDYGVFKIFTTTAVNNETERSKELGIALATCANATDEIGVIQFEKGNETRIYTRGNCVILEGKEPMDFLRVADKLVLHLLGVF